MTVTTLDVRNPGPMTGAGNHTYLVPGASPVLIDAGVGQPGHLEAIEAAGGGADATLRVLVTHIHPDHASGAPAIAARLAHARFAKYPWAGRDQQYALRWEPLADGDTIGTPEGPLVVIHTPGHVPDHVCFWHEDSRTLFSGDLATIGTTVVIPASQGGDLVAYLDSIRRVLALSPARMLPAHGPVIEDPRALLEEYLAHRAERERQVLEQLDAGVADLAAMVAHIYPDIDPRLAFMARESLTAHLVKLRNEGRVREVQGRWRLA